MPGLAAAVAARIHGMPFEDVILWFVAIFTISVILISRLRKPSMEQPHYWRLVFPIGAVVVLVALPLVVRKTTALPGEKVASSVQSPISPGPTVPSSTSTVTSELSSPEARPKPKPLPKPKPKPQQSNQKLEVAPSQPSQNCPNGVCIGGDNKGTATVINNGPPPPPTPTVKVCVSFDWETNRTTISLNTDVQIARPWFAFFFDGPVLDGSVELNDGRSVLAYAPARAVKQPFPEKSFLFRVNSIDSGPATWFPSNGTIKVTIPASAPVHLIKILAGAGDDPDTLFPENLISGCN
jgi:hypothetical protein